LSWFFFYLAPVFAGYRAGPANIPIVILATTRVKGL
jgi:hypothetical protein